MKFKRFDIVVHKPTFNGNMPTLLVILGYDEKRKKYKCFNMRLNSLDDENEILFCLEDELAFYKGTKLQEDIDYYLNFINSPEYNELYYIFYDVEGENFTKVRNAYRHRKGWDY